MKSLIKYELKRDRVQIISIFIGIIIIVNILWLLGIRNELGGGIYIIGLLLIFNRRTNHLANDTVFEDREHMMLIPKSILKIVVVNSIVTYIDCILLGGVLFLILDIKMFKLWMLFRAFLVVNVLFLFYQITTLLYIFFQKKIRKKSIATILATVMTIVISITIIVLKTIHVVLYSIKISNFIFVLLAILCIFLNAAVIGHKYTFSRIETKIMIGTIVLVIISSSVLIYSFNHFNKFNSELPFEKDENIIGNWETVDFVDDYEDYIPNTVNKHFYLKSLQFKENGIIDKYPKSRWTKGYIYYPFKYVGAEYIIKEIDGDTYMFMQWKNGDYLYFNMKPKYYILKKQ